MAFTIIDPQLGQLPIANTDAGYTPGNASSAIPTPPLVPGMIVQGQDPTFGVGEFILLAGVAAQSGGPQDRVSCGARHRLWERRAPEARLLYPGCTAGADAGQTP